MTTTTSPAMTGALTTSSALSSFDPTAKKTYDSSPSPIDRPPPIALDYNIIYSCVDRP